MRPFVLSPPLHCLCLQDYLLQRAGQHCIIPVTHAAQDTHSHPFLSTHTWALCHLPHPGFYGQAWHHPLVGQLAINTSLCAVFHKGTVVLTSCCPPADPESLVNFADGANPTHFFSSKPLLVSFILQSKLHFFSKVHLAPLWMFGNVQEGTEHSQQLVNSLNKSIFF